MPDHSSENLFDAISMSAAGNPGAAALLNLGKPALSRQELAAQVAYTVQRLAGAGVRPGQRVALLLPTGPQAATAFLGVIATTACCPINPALKPVEIESYMAEAGVKLLITTKRYRAALDRQEQRPDLTVWELSSPEKAAAGAFELMGPDLDRATGFSPGGGEDLALIMPTSGTTSRPKLVPLTQANLLAAAQAIIDGLELLPHDRCLNLMPLFHVHGLIAGVLAPLLAGGSSICPLDWQKDGFVNLFDELKPTWYTAVPTIHQTVLAAAKVRAGPENHGLRLIRSCSAALSPRLMSHLEACFNAPVLEAYGMTEATLQITSNPLPPGIRKPGSVGLPAGCRVTVMDESGNPLPAGAEGEVAIAGPSLFAGYENRPEANWESFRSGWFYTGDRGYRDAEGYLFLTGRAKEMINRGGENIAPRLVDEVLAGHPAVAEAVGFGVPHPTLGEEVAAAVSLKPGAQASESELQGYATQSLAYFQAPKRVLILPGLPKGPTGKLMRLGLADRLGLSPRDLALPASRDSGARPPGRVEAGLLGIWRDLLQNERIGRQDNFFFSGGDSLAAVQLFVAIEQHWGVRLPASSIYLAQTVQAQARLIRAAQENRPLSCLVPLNEQGRRPPLFLIHAHDGEVLFYKDLVSRLGPEQPVYGLQALLDADGLPFHATMEEMAAHYLKEIQEQWPKGPYLIGGFCFGALVAWEMGRQLETLGEKARLFLLDTYVPDGLLPSPGRHPMAQQACQGLDMLIRLAGTLSYVAKLRTRHKASYLAAWARFHGRQFLRTLYSSRGKALPRFLVESDFTGRPSLQTTIPPYLPQPLKQEAILFRANRGALAMPAIHHLGWAPLTNGGLKVKVVPGIHGLLLYRPFNRGLGREVSAQLAS